MSSLDETALKESLEASTRRREAARRRRQQQGQKTVLAAIALAVVVPFCLLMGLAGARAPRAPYLAVNWPKPESLQVMDSGQNVLFREGQPLSVSVTDPTAWIVSWKAPGLETTGLAVNFAPTDGNSALTASCRPVAHGVWRFFRFMWPKPRLSLQTRAPRRDGMYERAIDQVSGGVWLGPNIYASGPAGWDERALVLLGRLNVLVPDAANNPIQRTPTAPIWRVAGDFAGDTTKPARDGATYAVLQAGDLENLMPRLANKVLQLAPDVSLKFVVRLDKSPQVGIIRLAFDGKKERRAWVRRAGEASGGPLIGWINSERPGNLPPAMPRTAAKPRPTEKPEPSPSPTATAAATPQASPRATPTVIKTSAAKATSTPPTPKPTESKPKKPQPA